MNTTIRERQTTDMELMAWGQSVLPTKLFAPAGRPALVSRPRLHQRLEAGVQSGAKLILVAASAGFGKTTLVAEWGETVAHPFAWFSIDEADNDPMRFFTHLVAALRGLDEAVELELPRTTRGQLLPSTFLVTGLVNGLLALTDPFILVLDDYHQIHNPLIHEALERLLEHQPPAMRLVIITREDPPLPLPRLRVRGQLVEVRQDELRFTPAEAAAFLHQTTGLQLAPQTIETLEQRTEGWIAGLQLAALSIQGHDLAHAASFVQAFSGSHRYVIDYLVEEVMQQQDEATRRFLRQTAVLDRLCASLGDAVTERTGSKTMLTRLEHANLFLIPLDNRREWYRYHHLFAEFLRADLSQEQKSDLNLRAAHWFEAQGLQPEAIKYTLAAGDFEEAGRLIGQTAGEALRGGELVTLSNWIDALPEVFLHNRPDLLIYKAWLLWLLGQGREAEYYTQLAAEKLPATASRVDQGRLKCLQACLALALGEDGMRLIQEALPLLDDDDIFFKSLALLILGEAQNLFGETSQSINTFRQVLRLSQEHNDHFVTIGSLVNLVQQLNWQGKRREAVELCQQTLQQAVDVEDNPLPLAGLVYAALGEMEFYAANFDRALEVVHKGIELTEKRGLIGFALSCKYALAPIQQILGQTEAALASLQEIKNLIVESNFETYLPVFEAIEADFQRRSGYFDRVKQWANSLDLTNHHTLAVTHKMAHLVYTRWLISQERYAEALDTLAAFEAITRRAGRYFFFININILRTLIRLGLGEETAALASLQEAVRQAAPEGYRLQFLEEGELLAGLLPQVRPVAPNFVDDLLDRWEDLQRRRGLTLPANKPSQLHPAETLGFSFPIESLSERELELLELIAEGQSNREVAEQLVITVGTVKKHLNNIFGKLDVKNRTQAVARAREVGLID